MLASSNDSVRGLERVLHLFRQVNMRRVDEVFAEPQELGPSPLVSHCRVCEEQLATEHASVVIHMHLMVPGDKLHVHGIGPDLQTAKADAGRKAADLFVSLEPEIFSLKKARLRARLKDLGCTLPKSDAMRMLESANDPLSIESRNFPPSFRELIVMTHVDDEEGVLKSSEDISKTSEYFLRSIASFSSEECIEVFNQIGLAMVDELNRNMNEFVFVALILLTYRIPLRAIVDDEKIKLSFLKIFEQLIVFNSDKFVCGDRLVGKLLRYYLSERALPYLAKNRLEMLTVYYSVGGRSIMKVPDEGMKSHEMEDSLKLAKIVESKTPPKEYLDLLFSEFAKINAKISDLFKVDGQIYGSLVNGFPTNSSDIDVVINLGEHETGKEGMDEDEDEDTPDSNNVVLLNKLFESIHSTYSDEFELSKIDSARVPILKCKSRRSQVEIDISFNHEVVVHNSALLRAYSSMSPVVGQLVVLVKHWAKQRDLNDALQGTLSSYSYVLLVIHYLQSRKMLPDLQNPPKTVFPVEVLPTRITDGGRCSTWFLEETESVNYKQVFAYEIQKLESVSLKNLLVKFFEFYLYDFNFITDVATVTTAHSLKKRDAFVLSNPDSPEPTFEFRTLRRRTWFTIKDPFEIRRFLGTTARGTEILVREMRRGVELLLDGHIDELFEPFKNKGGGKPIQHPVPVRKLVAGDSTLSCIRFGTPHPRFPINPKLHLNNPQFCYDVVSFLESIRAIIQFGENLSISLNELRALLALTPIGLLSAQDCLVLGFDHILDRIDTKEIKRVISLVKKQDIESLITMAKKNIADRPAPAPRPPQVATGRPGPPSKKFMESPYLKPAGGQKGGKGKQPSREIGTAGNIEK